ncbi:PIG-L deacetylase family protein [Dyadobacter luticola]|uniref:PIG-L family deacetylase n=1 Tax=Dyadobacter luticola TaxID=1979387 RepID=A0A5R9KTM4_9BACT|nr:PIG-L deacetylase family protein [Dyadobacter luticola]TLU99560.1 PIG-L family deacetylase [Dyadobacter luticola]
MDLISQDDFIRHSRLLGPDQLGMLGRTLIVAPHQDDESLGCGGTIYLLTQLKIPIHVVFISDGSMSHPNSKKFPSDMLVALREEEAVKALSILGVEQKDITFLRLKDSLLPCTETPGFDTAVVAFSKVLSDFNTESIICPWQRDPHKDHRATWQIVDEAVKKCTLSIRQFEYFVWLWERASPGDLPAANEGVIWKVNIEMAKDQKKKAVQAHVSQTTLLIDDDPEGFILSAEVLAHFNTDYEILLERK